MPLCISSMVCANGMRQFCVYLIAIVHANATAALHPTYTTLKNVIIKPYETTVTVTDCRAG